MKLIKVTKNNSIYFEMSDGRLGVTYESGYVRVSTKRSLPMMGKLYQINKQVKKTETFKPSLYSRDGFDWEYIERQLIMCPIQRLAFLLAFDEANCQPIKSYKINYIITKK